MRGEGHNAELGELVHGLQAGMGLKLQPAVQTRVAEVAQELLKKGVAGSLREIGQRFRAGKAEDPVVRALTEAASVGETFFFRDREQLKALEDLVLRYVVPAKRARRSRMLRVWSAGCSTGEEAYTLAMLLGAAVPDFTVQVVGTDMSEAALETAREGIYRDRALRGVLPGMLAANFTRVKGGYRVNEAVRERVSFARLNLVMDEYPSSEKNVRTFDVALCRNVLIYLDPDFIPEVMRKVGRTLNPISVLALSATEYPMAHHALGFRDLTSGLLLRTEHRSDEDAGERFLPFVSPRGQTPSVGTPAAAPLGREPATAPLTSSSASQEPKTQPVTRLTLSREMKTDAAARPGVGAAEAKTSPGLDLRGGLTQMLRRVHEAIERGELQAALLFAQDISQAFPSSAEAAYQLAVLQGAVGEVELAIQGFAHVLAMDGGYVAAELGLADACVRQGDRQEARPHFQKALALLDRLTPSATVSGLGVSVAAARRLAESGLRECDA